MRVLTNLIGTLAISLVAVVSQSTSAGGQEPDITCAKCDKPSNNAAVPRLIRGSGPEVFLVYQGKRFWIPNEKTFNALGLDWKTIQTISDQQLNRIPRGDDYPSLSGPLVKGSSSEIFRLEKGVRRWIPNMATFRAMRLNMQAVKTISDVQLNNIPRGRDYESRE